MMVLAIGCKKENEQEDNGGGGQDSTISYPTGAVSSPWGVAGTVEGATWDKDIDMKALGDWHVVLGIEAKAGAEFKFRRDNAWDVNYGLASGSLSLDKELPLAPEGSNLRFGTAGRYDLYLAPSNGIAVVLKHGETFNHTEAGVPITGGTIAGASGTADTKHSGLTYQVNVYSFADSDGDGWGDFQGIIDHLDYFESLGVSALWLSPIQPAQSYHSYDITDYGSIRPLFGGKKLVQEETDEQWETRAESKFQELVVKAKAKHIDIYLDYVLNHSGDQCQWFKDATSDPESQYRKYYVFSDDYKADVAAGNVDNFAGQTDPHMGGWHVTSTGGGYKGRVFFRVDWNAKTVTVLKAEDISPVETNPKLWIYIGKNVGLTETSPNIFEIAVDMDTDWGFLVRSSDTTWDNGTKWGGDGTGIEWGKPYKLNNTTAANITFGGVSSYYFASFDKSMPDLNYGPYSTCETHPAFKALAATVDKWIGYGIAGLRLDAVMWIYQCHEDANISFLSKWYDRCNTSYKNAGGIGEFYMVAETWADTIEQMAPYYKGVPSHFNFYYWWTLSDRINKGRGSDFGSTIKGFRDKMDAAYSQKKYTHTSGLYDAIKLSNHDENRAASTLMESDQKCRLAAAVLLTSPGKPYIYQGEELGYPGVKNNGDQNVRQPIKWTTSGSLPTGWCGFDKSTISKIGSVEAQSADDKSLLNVYKRFSYVRNETPALWSGTIGTLDSGNNAVAAWYMNGASQYGGGKCLVLHNFSNASATTSLHGAVVPTANMTLSGTCAQLKTKAGGKPYLLISSSHDPLTLSSDGASVTLPAFASAVFVVE